MLFRLALKNVVSRKSSYAIVFFITLAVTLFCVANAVFDSTEQGVQNCFISSFTGDLVIRSKSKTQVSLFGDDTPVTGNMTRKEKIIPYEEIKKTVEALPELSGCVSQVTGAGLVSSGSASRALYVFGVNAQEYLNVMSAISIIEGEPFIPGEKGIMVCKALADLLGLSIGDRIQFSVAEGASFRIRSGTLTAIFDYATQNDIFERFVIADPDLVRDLMALGNSLDFTDIEIEEDKTDLLDIDMDIDSLFDDAFDVDAIWEDVEVAEVEPESVFTDDNYITESFSWNYLVVKLKNSSSASSVIRKLNKVFKKNGWPVEATDWRHAAGSTSLYLYWMRVIFNAGILIILAAGFIIINNTLIINILDQTREIGTLRAIGAKKRFISFQYMIETFTMTLTSGVLGTLLGILISWLITKAHITLTNSFLVQLFGSDALTLSVTASNISSLFLLAVGLGFIGWLYPVATALKVYPVKAMAGAK